MSELPPGVYMKMDGVVVPAATVPGPPGPRGTDSTVPGPPGLDGIVKSDTPPADPPDHQLWLDTSDL